MRAGPRGVTGEQLGPDGGRIVEALEPYVGALHRDRAVIVEVARGGGEPIDDAHRGEGGGGDARPGVRAHVPEAQAAVDAGGGRVEGGDGGAARMGPGQHPVQQGARHAPAAGLGLDRHPGDAAGRHAAPAVPALERAVARLGDHPTAQLGDGGAAVDGGGVGWRVGDRLGLAEGLLAEPGGDQGVGRSGRSDREAVGRGVARGRARGVARWLGHGETSSVIGGCGAGWGARASGAGCPARPRRARRARRRTATRPAARSGAPAGRARSGWPRRGHPGPVRGR